MNRYRFLQTLEAIAALFIVVGLMTLAAGTREYRASSAMASWPAAEGTILTAEAVQTERRGRSITYFDAVRLTYEYTVEGETYVTDRIGPAGQPVPADSAAGRDLLARYPPGARVTVYYDPDDPASAVLERELQTAALRAGVALALLGVAVLAARRLLRKWAQEDL